MAKYKPNVVVSPEYAASDAGDISGIRYTGLGGPYTIPYGFLGRGDFSSIPMYDTKFEGISPANLGFVTNAYRQFLGRAPTQAEQQYGTDLLNKGLTGAGAAVALGTSPEFQRQQEYQRAYTAAVRPGGYQEFSPSGQYQQPVYMPNYDKYVSAQTPYTPTYGTSGASPDLMAHIQNVIAGLSAPQAPAASGSRGADTGGGGKGHSSGGITELRTRWG